MQARGLPPATPRMQRRQPRARDERSTQRAPHQRPGVRARVTPSLPAPLAVVCHDAGAAHLILPWLDLWSGAVRACMAGPAQALWHARFGKQGLVLGLDAALDGAAMLLSGTSLVAGLEHRARIEAARVGLHSVAVVDHWIHYASRFQREGCRLLPDEIWVCDAEAFARAQATFPGQDIRLQPNTWLREQVERVAPCPDPNRHQTVLLLPEPAGCDWGRGQPGEEQALDFLVEHALCLGLRKPLTLRLRPHDSDPPGRWDTWIARHAQRHHVSLDTSPTLVDSLDHVAWVAGLESTALVMAQAASRRAVCLQPPWAPRARLPQRGLIHLRDLVPPG